MYVYERVVEERSYFEKRKKMKRPPARVTPFPITNNPYAHIIVSCSKVIVGGGIVGGA